MKWKRKSSDGFSPALCSDRQPSNLKHCTYSVSVSICCVPYDDFENLYVTRTQEKTESAQNVHPINFVRLNFCCSLSSRVCFYSSKTYRKMRKGIFGHGQMCSNEHKPAEILKQHFSCSFAQHSIFVLLGIFDGIVWSVEIVISSRENQTDDCIAINYLKNLRSISM